VYATRTKHIIALETKISSDVLTLALCNNCSCKLGKKVLTHMTEAKGAGVLTWFSRVHSFSMEINTEFPQV